MAGAAAIPEDAGSEVEREAPEEVDANDGEPSGQSEISALNDEVLDEADAYVGEDDAEEKPAAKKKVAAKSESEDKGEERPKAKVPPKKDSGANKRIQQLVERAKQSEARAAQAERQYRQREQQYQTQYQESQRRFNEIEREKAVSAKELEMIRHREEQAQEAALDPLEKAMRIERRK